MAKEESREFGDNDTLSSTKHRSSFLPSLHISPHFIPILRPTKCHQVGGWAAYSATLEVVAAHVSGDRKETLC